MLPKDAAQRRVKQMRSGVISPDRRSPLCIDESDDSLTNAEITFSHLPPVHNQLGSWSLRILDNKNAGIGPKFSVITDLSSGFAVERGPLEYIFALVTRPCLLSFRADSDHTDDPRFGL